MAAVDLEQYVQRKRRGAREYFYFRVVKEGKETRLPLPHPFDPGYRAAYDAAHIAVFGISPNEFESPTAITALIRQHKDSERYRRLKPDSRRHRDYGLALMLERWGQFDTTAIRPVHVQAVYDSLSDRPATANRRLAEISAVFGWGRPRGFVDANPCIGVEKITESTPREPWPDDALATLMDQGQPHIVRPALVAAYTGQRRGDLLHGFSDSVIRGGVWYVVQGKTGSHVPIPLHPVVLAIADTERATRRAAGVVDPRRPLLVNSLGEPWTSSGFAASWRKELIRLKLRPHRNEDYGPDDFQPTFHGLRRTSATLIATTVARNPDLFGGIGRVKSMLGHLSESMAAHYARRAEAEHMNTETMLLFPQIGNTGA
ncbi:tyrosine-type recombinase/integrase [Oceaniglobus indicus]|uniref:tyrosine-type recombinase/integrase n=1 Tax=Oceaniglobus indicus TaxID=2047749 RepID=UPI0011AB4D57|nr:hypothetical protein [Oceaniglobus indicus]